MPSWIEPFIMRLICMNGMTDQRTASAATTSVAGSRTRCFLSDEAMEADDKALWLVARDTVKLACSRRCASTRSSINSRETITGEKIQAPAAATETLAQKFGLTDERARAGRAEPDARGDLSQWGMLNAVTATAKEVDSFDRQAEMEAMGWDIAKLSTKEWASIAVVS